ncbi:hypothetical protein O6H91_01G009900 [Diphasiastrum complanatum]|uniref:Uncharacterized protein n=1 Tax=Diphasiastrum complanatum TaxID=34168 RepID=A0ACC2EMZ4_DIPCM|nr:hypothetical protein O6H91_01G009900 [Diphasiastrum complanatum]
MAIVMSGLLPCALPSILLPILPCKAQKSYQCHLPTTTTAPALPRSQLQQQHGSRLGRCTVLFTHNAGIRRSTGSKRCAKLVAMAIGESESSDATTNLFKGLQDAWDKTEDKLAIGGLGFAALIVLWASTGLISAIDKLPLIPAFFELVGILFVGWFVYRYLLFKPEREELVRKIEEAKEKITGQ